MDYVVPWINKALRKMWWFALTAATLLYLLVFFKVVTPVLNYYSDYLLLPIAENIAPKDLHVSKVQLGWLNLSPIIILPKIDATDISSMPNVKDISSLSLSIDLFESILEQAVVVDYLYLDYITLSIKESKNTTVESGNALNNLVSRFGEKFNEFSHFRSVIPQRIFINKLRLYVETSEFEFRSLSFSDNDDYKHWQFRLILPTTNFTKVDATLESVDEDGDLVKVIGDVIFDGELPIYLSKKLSLPHELTSLSGKVISKVTYDKNDGFQVKSSHNLNANFKKKVNREVKVTNLRGITTFNFKDSDNFSLESKVDKIRINNSLTSGLSMSYVRKNSHEIIDLNKFDLSYFDLITPFLLSEKNKFYKMFNQPVLSGNVMNFHLKSNINKPQKISELRFKLDNFETKSYSMLPEVKNVNMNVNFVDNSGNIELFSNQNSGKKSLSIFDKRIIKKRIFIQPQVMNIEVNRMNNVWSLSSQDINFDIGSVNFFGNALIELSPSSFPAFYLNINSSMVKIETIRKLFPLKNIPKGLNDYLKQLLVSGDMRDIKFILTNSGRDSVDLSYNFSSRFSNAVFSYDNEWPTIKAANGRFSVKNDEVNIVTDSAVTTNQKVDKINVNIKSFTNPKITANVSSSIQQKNLHRYLRQSPLYEKLRYYVDNFETYGKGSLSLKLDFGLIESDIKLKNMHGRLSFRDNSLLYKKYGLDFKKVFGEIIFDDKNIFSQNLSAILDNNNINANLQKKNDKFNLSLNGLLDLKKNLSKFIPEDVAEKISGITKTDLNVTVDKNDNVEINAISNSGGIISTYPKPFLISKDDKNVVKVFAKLTDNNLSNFHVSLNDSVRVEKDFTAVGESSYLRIFSPEISYSDWRTFSNSQNKNPLPNISIKAKNFIINDINFANSKLDILDLKDKISIKINSDDAVGSIDIIPNVKISANLKKLNLRLPKSETGKSFDQSVLNNMDVELYIENINYEDLALNDFNLVLRKTDRGYSVDAFKMNLSDSNVSVTGYWNDNPDPKTYLEGVIDAKDIGKILGLVPDINYLSGGNGEIKFKLSWKKLPVDMSIKDMRGIVIFNLRDGKVSNLGEDVSAGMGLGIILNSLSLQSIMNKIAIEPTEMEGSYYPYSELLGSVTLDKGVVETDKILLQGSLGTVLTKGYVDIKHSLCDLYLTILPNLTSSIPTIATVTGGIATGAIAWLASKFLEEPASEMALQAYHVSGHIKDPDIKSLDRNNLPKDVILP